LVSLGSRRYWWVNHGETFRREIDGGYLWSARRNSSGARAADDLLARPLPGDLVFSFADGRLGAVGLVIERARTAPPPAELAGTGKRPRARTGWLLPVRFEALPHPLVPRDHRGQLASALSGRGSPLRATGERNRSVYLTALPPTLVATLRELLGEQLPQIEERVAIETSDRLTDAALEEQIWQRANLDPRSKRQHIDARGGQGIFRENVERIERACRVTGVLDRRHLRTVHIKTWRLCDDREQLDGFNGLLLSPHVAHLFERGHVSFDDDGRLLISRHLNPSVVKAWGLDQPYPPRPFRSEQRAYLQFHRRNVLERLSAGRRS
jgi:putative restriction endonuclease